MKKYLFCILAALLMGGTMNIATAEGKQLWQGFSLKSSLDAGDGTKGVRQLVVNGDFEGSDFSCFSYKVNKVIHEVTAENIVEEDGNHCLKIVSQEDAKNSYDSQFYIKLPEGVTLYPGTRVSFSMRVKASMETYMSTEGHRGPGHYLCWNLFGNQDAPTEWETVGGTYTVPYNDSPDAYYDEKVNTIAFNLKHDLEHVIEFYFDDISITITQVEGYELVANGDVEGSGFSSFSYKVNKVVHEVTAENVVEEDGNHCLKIVSQEDAKHSYDSQFYIKLPEGVTLAPGTMVTFTMRVKANQETFVPTEGHSTPGNYLCWNVLGNHFVTTEWDTIGGTYVVPSNDTSNASLSDKVGAIAFNLSSILGASTEFYFDDISITVSSDDLKLTDITFAEQVLLKGQTYTHEDFDIIKSGSFSVSKDGNALTFDNLVIEEQPVGVLFEASKTDLSVVLKGDCRIFTSKGKVMRLTDSHLTITGDGALTTQSVWYDFWLDNCDVLIDHTTLICNGLTAIGNNNGPMEKLIVRNSTFKGNTLFGIISLTLINSAFVSPKDVVFDWESTYGSQLYTSTGEQVNGFEIQPVEGDFTHRVRPWSFDDIIIGEGKTRNVTFSMKNEGIEEVREIAYVVSVGDVASQVKTISLNKPYAQTGDDFMVTIPIEASSVASNKELALTVTKVNGQKNTSPGKTVKGVLYTTGGGMVKRVVVEEFTGTWCGNCTRGTLALELLNKEYGNDVITIAVHYDDPMETSSYTQSALSFPSARVNRGELTDPYYGNSTEALGIKALIEEEQNIAALAGIEASAAWTTDGQSAIRVKTKTTFAVSDDASNYGIGLALLQDGMKGAGSDWAQVNYYSGDSADGDPYLSSITALPSLITDIEYNHVAVDAWDIDSGIDGSVKGIQINVPQMFTYVCDISGNKLIQDKSKLKVVALLINKRTGKICNAAQAIVLDASTGIADVKAADSERTTYYTIDGQRVSQPQKGMNIVRGADGATRKILRK